MSIEGDHTMTVHRFELPERVLDFDADDRDGYSRVASGAILALGEAPVGSTVKLTARTEFTDQRDEPIALVIVAPEGMRLAGFRTRPPDKEKVFDGRIAYYWFPPGDDLSAVPDQAGPYRQRVVWEKLDVCEDLDAEVARLEDLKGERYALGPTDGHPTDGVNYPDDVVATIVAAHYPRHLSAVDRERSQAQLALGGLTSLVAIGFAAVGLSQQSSDPSLVSSLTLAAAVVAWLATAVVGALAFLSPAKAERPPPTVSRTEFVDHILSVARQDAETAGGRLRWALATSLLAILLTGAAVVALALDSGGDAKKRIGVIRLRAESSWSPPPECRGDELVGVVTLPSQGGVFLEIRDVACGGVRLDLAIPRDAVGSVVLR